MIKRDQTEIKYFLLGGITIIFLAVIVSFTSLNKSTNADTSQEYPQNYKILIPHIPEDLDFAGEKVPLDNFDVKERIVTLPALTK